MNVLLYTLRIIHRVHMKYKALKQASNPQLCNPGAPV